MVDTFVSRQTRKVKKVDYKSLSGIKTRKQNSSISQRGEEKYTVEEIRDEKTFNGVKEYLIKWLGYPDEDCTWVSEAGVFCNELITEFRNRKIVLDQTESVTDNDTMTNEETVGTKKQIHINKFFWNDKALKILLTSRNLWEPYIRYKRNRLKLECPLVV